MPKLCPHTKTHFSSVGHNLDPNMKFLKKSPLILMVIALMITGCSKNMQANKGWYKGNLHTHSYWSDGDEFPEVIMEWYKSNGYNSVSYTHLRAHETDSYLVCRLLLE